MGYVGKVSETEKKARCLYRNQFIVKALKIYNNNKKEVAVLVCSFIGCTNGWPTVHPFIQLTNAYFAPSSKRVDQEREVNQVDKAEALQSF